MPNTQINIFDNNVLPGHPTASNLQEADAIWNFNWYSPVASIIALLTALYRGVAVATGSFTRPADTTAYASGDLVANSTTAGSVVPIPLTVARFISGNGGIRRVRLTKTNTSTTNASFRVHFYRALPTVTNGDNGAWLSTQSTYIGSVDVTMDRVFSDAAKGIGAVSTGLEINFDCAVNTRQIYALIEARAAYTPASAEVFSLAVEVQQN